MSQEELRGQVRAVTVSFAHTVGAPWAATAHVTWRWSRDGMVLEEEGMQIPVKLPYDARFSDEWLRVVMGEIILSL